MSLFYLCRDGAAVPRDRRSAILERRGVFLAWIAASHLLLARDPESGLWDLPGGGVKPAESDVPALRRELREETSLRLEDAGQLRALGRIVQPFYARRRGQFWRYDMQLFLGDGFAHGQAYDRAVTAGDSRWMPRAAMSGLAINAAHRRLIASSLETHAARGLPADIRDLLRAVAHPAAGRACDAQRA